MNGKYGQLLYNAIRETEIIYGEEFEPEWEEVTLPTKIWWTEIAYDFMKQIGYTPDDSDTT